MAAARPTIHEVDICPQTASEMSILIRQNPSAYPFRDVCVEGFDAPKLL